jgi:UDP-N-acetylglucosamine--N-acetylmuramyl-(pentapeptide) pyrophosphoryl-undecaprenol N-acetylglucosamine transferase
MKKQSCIAVVAARSGGHIIPGMTLAHTYCSTHKDTKILFFSTSHSFDQKIISTHSMPVHHIALSLDNVPSRWYGYPLFLAQCFGSLCSSMYHLAKHRPSSVILMGGYVSAPVCLAALILHIPRELYELNATPGSATNFLAPLVTKIHVCFATAQSHFKQSKTVVTKYPLRFAKPTSSKSEGLAQLGLDAARKTVLILGGSQGSVGLNKILFNCLQNNTTLPSKINIIHQTGAQDSTRWADMYTAMNIPNLVFDYHHDLSLYYQVSDIIIGRAGAGTIFESLFFEKTCILVPLENAGNDHQLHNALAIAQEYPKLFKVVRQQEVAGARGLLLKELEKLV